MIKSLFDGRLVMRVSLPILSLALAALLAVPPGHAQTPPQSESPAEPAPSLRDRLKARFADLSVAADEAEDAARTYEAGSGSRSIAVAVKAHHTWTAAGRSPQEATLRTLEGCQVQYGEPCTLVAAGDKVETKPAQDMPRVKYSGRFEPERTPFVRDSLAQRADVNGYRAVSGAKAAAYHPLGWLFVVTGTPSQFDAEEQALTRCNDDLRVKAEHREGIPDERQPGPCFLYAQGDRVVLPQRLTKPRPKPRTVAEAFDYLGMSQSAAPYAGGADHKAVAIAPERGSTYFVSRVVSAVVAEQRALEGCQLQYRTRCVMLASDNILRSPDLWTAERREVPRLEYKGAYAPEQVPLFSGTEDILTSYALLSSPKAMVIRPRGSRVRIATGASTVEAQSKALASCNSDLDFTPCFVYAVDERVVLDRRRTEPLE
jgi:hypothetical protein